MHRLSLIFVLACASRTPPVHSPPVSEQAVVSPAARGVTDPRLAALLVEHWDHTMARAPTWATRLGDHRYDDRLGDYSEEGRARSREARDAFLARAKALQADIEPSDALTLELFVWGLEDDVRQDVCRFAHWSVQPRGNRFTSINGLPEGLPVETRDDGANLLARYRAAPQTIDDEIRSLRLGLEDGLVANAHSVELVVEMIDRQLAQPVEEWPLADPLEDDRDWDPGEVDQWKLEMVEAIGEIGSSFERYRDVLRDELLPRARPQDQTGLAALPNGEACYAALVQKYTTLERPAEQVHQQGLEALEGIHEEFRELGETLWGTRDLEEIFERLRTDPELYFESRDEVEAKAASALAAARAAMPSAFGVLPRAECVVEPIPDYQAPYTTIAYYQPPTPGERPGTYFVNTWAPETRPRHEAEVLAFHEAIPGHHLQIAISQELPEVPSFRRHMGFTVYVEGWALYTERLSEEMGLYSGDLDRMGMLSFDAWRASRLVVDTGVHHKGWSREEAVRFLVENTPLAKNNIANEVDRYITWPGQAVAYKTGQIEITRMRREAEASRGEAFDLSAFHDRVLGAGALPLPLLEERLAADW